MIYLMDLVVSKGWSKVHHMSMMGFYKVVIYLVSVTKISHKVSYYSSKRISSLRTDTL